MEKPISVLIGIPIGGTNVSLDFVKAYLNFLAESAKNGFVISTAFHHTKPLHEARNDLAKKVVEGKHDYLMFIDADNIIPKDALVRLHKQDKEVVSGLYWSIGPPHSPIAYYRAKGIAEEKARYYALPDWEDGSLIEVDGFGMGCCLIRSKVFNDLSFPWFTWATTSKGMVRSEDFYFCEKAKEAGYKLWLDTSVNVGHLTTVVVNKEDYLNSKIIRGDMKNGKL